MSLNKNKKTNYNLVVYLCIGIFITSILNMFLFTLLNFMFYKSNFYNNNNQSNTQVVNIDNTPKYDKIDINNCSYESLDNLEGIGEVKAKKIINNRPYKDIYQIKKLIGEKTFDNIKNYIKTKEVNDDE